jgi:hypothetical protein
MIVDMAKAGFPNREISRQLGYHKNQIRRVLSLYPDADSARCPCGLSRKHQGWCSERFKASATRQETIRLMHLKVKWMRMKEQGLIPEGVAK